MYVNSLIDRYRDRVVDRATDPFGHADYPLAQAAFLLIAIVVLLANLVVDVLYAYLDPRIRY